MSFLVPQLVKTTGKSLCASGRSCRCPHRASSLWIRARLIFHAVLVAKMATYSSVEMTTKTKRVVTATTYVA
jgi:hypothetical protein